MRGFLVSSAVLLSAIACTAQFEIPSGTQVRCGGNSECPTGYECVAGQCKALNVNEPPQVTIGQISRSVGVVRIPINVADAEGDPVSLDVEVQPV